MQLIFEKSRKGRRAFRIPAVDVPVKAKLPSKYCRSNDALLAEVSELDLVRHFTNLSRLNFSVDTNFYPLGSCTMKYNPKFTEQIAGLEGFRELHPLFAQLDATVPYTQGALEVLFCAEQVLCEITGMTAFTTQPLAGAHGELTGAMIIAAYHRHKGNTPKYVIVPDSSHGTNPASAAIAGYEVMVIPTDKDGYMDMEAYKSKLGPESAAVMLTCPDTLGIFNPRIKEIADLAHKAGVLMYYDGANLNAVLGKVRPGDLGFDIVHLNLHKTFATPHGGGGPGAGPVGVTARLSEFLPVPRVIKKRDNTFALEYKFPHSIGPVAPFYGNFGVILKALAYIMLLGKTGLIEVSEIAVLNANYCLARLKDFYQVAYNKNRCMHECILSAVEQAKNGVRALDIAKYLIDKGFHPPTIYFPLIVKEALMIEPTETESKETLDSFIAVMIEIAKMSKTHPELVVNAPLCSPVKRLDETKAARELNLRWRPPLEKDG
ncbi:MAG: glycine dehydrogenase subunit 2 [Candidatus Omnitrophota bacterium]|jgi:glycine dehydrogenase subunit 2|nr:MAG: glycine dehydrogenase subunit 2 [Candidatus Omnitrophota bacterium]